MDPRQIEAFRAVARGGGFSRAARALGVGQPSLTRSVARLEAGLGFPLFLRGQGTARLTPEGEAFLREVERAFIGLDRLRIAANEIRDFGTGRLRVACLTAFASGLIPRALKRFTAAFPDATVSLQVRPSATVYEWVSDRRCDLGFAAPRTGFRGVEEERIFSAAALLAMPAGHRLATGKGPATPADLAGEAFLAHALEDNARHAADSVFEAAGVSPRIPIETQYGATLCALVAQGLGVAIVSPVVARDYAMLPIATRPFEPAVTFTTNLVRPRGEPLSRLAQAFLEFVRSEAADIEASAM